MPNYKSKPVNVRAIRIAEEMEVKLKNGETQTGNPGDWMLVKENNQARFMKDKAFRKKFDPSDEDAQIYPGWKDKEPPIPPSEDPQD